MTGNNKFGCSPISPPNPMAITDFQLFRDMGDTALAVDNWLNSIKSRVNMQCETSLVAGYLHKGAVHGTKSKLK